MVDSVLKSHVLIEWLTSSAFQMIESRRPPLEVEALICARFSIKENSSKFQVHGLFFVWDTTPFLELYSHPSGDSSTVLLNLVLNYNYCYRLTQ
ncbi:hypothetical protein SDJN03_05820, partial [Cucurbita argyrosperma subsp. sororia]